MKKLWRALSDFLAFLWQQIVGYVAGVDPGMVKAILLKLVRHFLTASGPLLAAHGWLNNSELSEYIGSAEFVTGFLLSVWDAYKVRAKINAAVVVGRAEVGKLPEKNAAVATLKDTVKS